MVYSCEEFNQSVYGQPIFITSYHKPLEVIRKPISSTLPRVQRFLVRLMKYDMQMELVPGKFLSIVDVFSRTHSLSVLEKTDLDEEAALMIPTLYPN